MSTPARRRRHGPSRRVLRCAALFGLSLTPPSPTRASPSKHPSRAARARAGDAVAGAGDGPATRLTELVAHLDHALAPGAAALITGPSGSGKTTLLRVLAARLRARAAGMGSAVGRGVILVTEPRDGAGAVVDLFQTPLEETLALLARAGLAEASWLVRSPSTLSAGQRARLALALALARAQRASCPRRAVRGAARHRGGGAGGAVSDAAGAGPITILADEFCTGLDRLTAQAVARTFARAIRPPLRLVAATAHDDLHAALAPALSVELGLGGEPPSASWLGAGA